MRSRRPIAAFAILFGFFSCGPAKTPQAGIVGTWTFKGETWRRSSLEIEYTADGRKIDYRRNPPWRGTYRFVDADTIEEYMGPDAPPSIQKRRWKVVPTWRDSVWKLIDESGIPVYLERFPRPPSQPAN